LREIDRRVDENMINGDDANRINGDENMINGDANRINAVNKFDRRVDENRINGDKKRINGDENDKRG